MTDREIFLFVQASTNAKIAERISQLTAEQMKFPSDATKLEMQIQAIKREANSQRKGPFVVAD